MKISKKFPISKKFLGKFSEKNESLYLMRCPWTESAVERDSQSAKQNKLRCLQAAPSQVEAVATQRVSAQSVCVYRVSMLTPSTSNMMHIYLSSSRQVVSVAACRRQCAIHWKLSYLSALSEYFRNAIFCQAIAAQEI